MNVQEKQTTGIIFLMILFFVWLNFFMPIPSTHGQTSDEKEPEREKTFIEEINANFSDKAPDDKKAKPTLETDEVHYTFSRKGAQPHQIKLKKYKNRDGKQVTLLHPDHNHMGWTLYKKGEKNPSYTHKLTFSIEKTPTQITFSHQKETDLSIVITYWLDRNVLKHKILLGNGWDSEQQAQFIWSTTPQNQETHLTMARRKTYIAYGEEGGYDNYQSEKEKKEIDKARWITFHIPFFVKGFITKEQSKATIGIKSIKEEGDERLKKMVLQINFSTKKLQEGNELTFYFGPNTYEALKEAGLEHPKANFEKNHYFGPSFIIAPINHYIISPIFTTCHHLTGHALLSLLLLILLLSLLLFYFLYKSEIVQLKSKVCKPFLDAIKEKKGENTQFAENQFSRNVGINPLVTILSVFVNIFFFISMSCFTRYSILFRQQSFLWIKDISTYDDLISLPFAIPLLGKHISLIALIAFTLKMISSHYLKSDTNGKVENNPMMSSQMKYIQPIMILLVSNSRAVAFVLYQLLITTIQPLQKLLCHQLIDKEKIERETLEKAIEASKKIDTTERQTRMERRKKRK